MKCASQLVLILASLLHQPAAILAATHASLASANVSPASSPVVGIAVVLQSAIAAPAAVALLSLPQPLLLLHQLSRCLLLNKYLL